MSNLGGRIVGIGVLFVLFIGAAGSALADDTGAPSVQVFEGDSCKPPCGQARDACCWPLDARGCRYGRWEITAEGVGSCLYSPEGPLGTTVYGAGSQLSWDAVDYDATIGGRLAVCYAIVAQEWVQLKGVYYGTRDASATGVGVFGFEPGFAVPGPGQVRDVSDTVAATLASEAEAWGAELNYVSELSCSGRFRWDALFGGRYVQFNEMSRVDFSSAPLPGFAGPAFVDSDVENLFVGLQVGAVFHWDLHPCFELNGTLKAMGGNIRREALVSDQSIFVGGAHSASSEDDEIVFGAEIELGFKWRFHPRLAVTGGYNLLFLDNVLRGYDAMDFTHSDSGAVQAVQATDQLLLQSLFLGLNVNF